MASSSRNVTLCPASEPDPLSSLNFWINGIVTNVVVVLGLIGNTLTIIVLTRRAMRSSTNFYLCALAVWDAVVLIWTALLTGLQAVPALSYYTAHFYAYVVSYVYPVAVIAQTATIWLTVSFTVERYIAVCHPLKTATMCTISRAKTVIVGVSLGSTLYNIPRWFDYRPSECYHAEHNATIVQFGRTEFGKNAIYREVYFSWLYVPIMCIVPLLVLSILNMFLILAVRRSMKQRKNMNVKQSCENNVTMMLVTVVIVFIICQVPALVYNIAFAIDDDYVEANHSYRILSHFRNFLVCLNSAVNFLLYCALGQKFRTIFLQTFCGKCKKARVPGYSQVATTPPNKTHVTRMRVLNGKYNKSDNDSLHTNGKVHAVRHDVNSHNMPSDASQVSRNSASEGLAEPQDKRNAFHTDFMHQNGSCI